MPETWVLPANLEIITINDNVLTRIPATWVLPATLKILLLQNNALTSVPASWVLPDGMTDLSLDNNALTCIPASWLLPASLETLLLHNNALTNLPSTWVLPDTLTALDLTNNALTSLPETWVFPDGLMILRLQNNALISVPEMWKFPNTMLRIYLADNALTGVPDTWNLPRDLLQLRLDNNALTTVPETWVLPDGLTDLNLAYNTLRSVPKTWVFPETLQKLNLDHNALTRVPESWVLPNGLQALVLRNNALESLPETWVLPDGLLNLVLRNNALTCLPETWVLPDGLISLDLSHNALTSIPSTWILPEGMMQLNLGDNNIDFNTFISASASINAIFASSKLKEVDLSNNLIERVDEIIWPPTLRHLDLSRNMLQTVPFGHNFGWPPSLETLLLDGNTWELVIAAAARNSDRTGESIVGTAVPMFSDLRIPCLSNDLNISVEHLNWNCNAATYAANSSLSEVDEAPTCSVNCFFTAAGAVVVAARPETVAAGIESVNEQYTPVWAAGVPAAATAAAAMGFVVSPSSPMEWFRLVIFAVSALDLMTDWAFYSIEMSSNMAFQSRYTCNSSDPALIPEKSCRVNEQNDTNESQSSFSCALNNFGRLKSKCGEIADSSNVNAVNECECRGFVCDVNDPTLCRYSNDDDDDVYFSEFRTISCMSFGSLDEHSNEECGVLLGLTGTNECECYNGMCQNVPGTGGSCPTAGSADNDFQALVSTCLSFNIVASIVWCVQWVSFALHSRTTAANTRTGASTPFVRNINTASMIAATLFEDIPQMYFLITYAKYMGVLQPGEELASLMAPGTKRLVLISLLMSSFSMLAVVIEVTWRLCCQKPTIARTKKSGKTLTLNPAFSTNSSTSRS